MSANGGSGAKKRILILAVSGVLIFIVGFLTGSFWSTVRFMNFKIKVADMDYSPDTFPFDSGFWEMKYFGGESVNERSVKPLPEGDGYLTGRFTFDGKPASGIKFTITINSKYKSGLLETDGDGKFEIRLPEGKWYINSIGCKEWKNKPDGNFILITGDESTFQDGSVVDFDPSGKEVIVTGRRPEKEQISVAINRRMKMIWPIDHEVEQEAAIARSQIKWEAYPGAQDYMLSISSVKRKGQNHTIYSFISHKKISGANFLALSDLGHIQLPGTKEEYAVSVKAYGSHGELLSESEYFSGTFTLTDGNIIEERNDYSSALPVDKEIMQFIENEKMENAVEMLIKERLFQDASVLLDKMKDGSVPGKKELLNGYLHAARGDCKKAERFFIEAQNKGLDCVPEEFKGDCKIDVE